MEFDLSELENKSFQCLDGCAMCCLCQPELSDAELEIFEKAGLTDGLTREHIQGYVSDKTTAIKLQGGQGACHFLKDRFCTIYQNRPAFCRQFPVHIHSLNRIQLNANLSCRGIGFGGDSLSKFGKKILTAIPTALLEEKLASTQKLYRSFESACKENGVHQTPKRLRSVTERLIPLLAEKDGLEKLLAFANTELSIGNMAVKEIVKIVLSTEPADDLAEIACEGNYEQFIIENPAWLPVYVDGQLRWHTFRSDSGKIRWLALHEDGKLENLKSYTMKPDDMLEPYADARTIFNDYATLLNSRDQFLGYACYVCADQDFTYDLMTVYLGVLATTLLDLRWRASLVGKVAGKSRSDRELAIEGVRAFDMDCLDMPTIGTFL